MENIFLSNFSTLYTLVKKDITDAPVCEKSILINPDLNYINWVIKTVDFFSLPPSFLNSVFHLKKLRSFEVKRLNTTIFEYKPIIDESDYEFSNDIKEINKKKFESKFNLQYNETSDFYSYNLPDTELMNRFGFYLDENYSVGKQIDRDENTFDNYQNDSYGEYAGTYAQDIEGLSDVLINDVLDGNPDAYWNID